MPRSYSDEELIQGIRDLASDIGEKPTQKQMRLEGPYSINAYKRAFGSWNDALSAAGYVPRTQHQKKSESELLDSLEQVADELGRLPTQSDINEHSKHSHKTYYRVFEGGLEEAKRRVGLEHYEKPSKDRVRVLCEYCGTVTEKTPSELSTSELSYCSKECHYSHKKERYAGRGNPQSTLKEVSCDACGTAIDRPKWKRELNERHFCDYECMGDWREGRIDGENHPQWKDYPTLECEWCEKNYSVKPSEKQRSRFCSNRCMWSSLSETYSGEGNPSWTGGGVELVCQHCEDEYIVKKSEANKSKYCSASCRMSNRTGEDHPRWHPDSERTYYGANWSEQRKRAIRRDQARCQAPGCGCTEADSLVQYGLGLDVHHLTPIRKFERNGEIEYTAANSIDNLLTLCRECHVKTDAGDLDLRAG